MDFERDFFEMISGPRKSLKYHMATVFHFSEVLLTLDVWYGQCSMKGYYNQTFILFIMISLSTSHFSTFQMDRAEAAAVFLRACLNPLPQVPAHTWRSVSSSAEGLVAQAIPC